MALRWLLSGMLTAAVDPFDQQLIERQHLSAFAGAGVNRAADGDLNSGLGATFE